MGAHAKKYVICRVSSNNLQASPDRCEACDCPVDPIPQNSRPKFEKRHNSTKPSHKRSNTLSFPTLSEFCRSHDWPATKTTPYNRSPREICCMQTCHMCVCCLMVQYRHRSHDPFYERRGLPRSMGLDQPIYVKRKHISSTSRKSPTNSRKAETHRKQLISIAFNALLNRASSKRCALACVMDLLILPGTISPLSLSGDRLRREQSRK